VIRVVLPCVKVLAADSSQYVRSALAAVVMEMAPALGKSATIEHLLPVFLSLLKDDVPDVRLNIISKLDQVLFLVGPCEMPTARFISQAEAHSKAYAINWFNHGFCR
jgi:hypothetical protein